MRVLVTEACGSGGTAQFADNVYCTLRRNGVEANLIWPEEVYTLDGFTAVVLGSTMDSGSWHTSALELIDRLSRELRERKVWLFSYCCPENDGQPNRITMARLKILTGAVEHRFFPAAVGREKLDFAEQAAMSTLVRPVAGALGESEAHKWAVGIARTLRAESRVSEDWHLSV